jgi:hypothetical protein
VFPVTTGTGDDDTPGPDVATSIPSEAGEDTVLFVKLTDGTLPCTPTGGYT